MVFRVSDAVGQRAADGTAAGAAPAAARGGDGAKGLHLALGVVVHEARVGRDALRRRGGDGDGDGVRVCLAGHDGDVCVCVGGSFVCE